MNHTCFKRPYFLVFLLDLNYAIYQSLVVTLEITSPASDRLFRFHEFIKAEILRKATLLTYREFGLLSESYVPCIYFSIGNQKFMVSLYKTLLQIGCGPIGGCSGPYRMQMHLDWGLNIDGSKSWCRMSRHNRSRSKRRSFYSVSERQLIDQILHAIQK